MVSSALRDLTQLPTPEEATRLCASMELDVPANRPYCLYGLGTGHVSCQEYVKVGKVRLAQPFVELKDFMRRCLGAFDLLVCRVVAWGVSYALVGGACRACPL
jgi:hypothetical protein